MRKIQKCSYVYFTRDKITRPDNDAQCVKNIYLQVVTEPYCTSVKDEKAVRLSDELALFSRYYQNKLNTGTMADFVRSIKENNVPIPPTLYGDSFEYCRSRYIQSPSELANYCSFLQHKSDKMVYDARLARAREAAQAAASKEANDSSTKEKPDKSD